MEKPAQKIAPQTELWIWSDACQESVFALLYTLSRACVHLFIFALVCFSIFILVVRSFVHLILCQGCGLLT